jgi:hypothetical protein
MKTLANCITTFSAWLLALAGVAPQPRLVPVPVRVRPRRRR